MNVIKDLDPPYIWGPGWKERRNEICQKEGTEELCAHPFMDEIYEHYKPMPV